MADLIPEVAVTDLAISLTVCRALGFEVVYDRPGERFARIRRRGTDIMLDQPGHTRDLHGPGPDDRPFDRGVNFQIEVTALLRPGHAARLGPETRGYRTGTQEIGQRQRWLEDPDVSLLRFREVLGRRPEATG